MKRHRDSDGCPLGLQLHDSVTAALANSEKSALIKDIAYFRA